jgi:hypothetical protein
VTRARCSSASPRVPRREEEEASRVSTECEGVARAARCHSGPKSAPEPQLTISARRPEVSSNAAVEAWAVRAARPPGGGEASTITLVRRPERRAKPMATGCGSPARAPAAARAWSSRPSCPLPPPWKRASSPSAWRSARRAGAMRVIASGNAGGTGWALSPKARADQVSRVSTSSSSSGLRLGMPPSASMSDWQAAARAVAAGATSRSSPISEMPA